VTWTFESLLPSQLRIPGEQRLQAVFLDRDGVINENRVDHVKNWSEFRFLPGSAESIRRLRAAGCRVFVISNQAIIGRGVVAHTAVDAVNGMMLRELRRHGAYVDAVEYCPHRPQQDCACRKPRPGLLLRLATRFGLDLKKSVVIGDALTDIDAGLAVGSSAILVLSGRGKEQLADALASGKKGFVVARDLPEATDLVLKCMAAGAS
jgi:D-glycero-D-manno-heptose 1,7-bisphosphate phosphatase